MRDLDGSAAEAGDADASDSGATAAGLPSPVRGRCAISSTTRRTRAVTSGVLAMTCPAVVLDHHRIPSWSPNSGLRPRARCETPRPAAESVTYS